MPYTALSNGYGDKLKEYHELAAYTHIEILDWPNRPHQPPTTFVYLGSLRNRKVGLITIHSAKSVDVEMLTLND